MQVMSAERRFRGDRVGTAFLSGAIPVAPNARTERRASTTALGFPLVAQIGTYGVSHLPGSEGHRRPTQGTAVRGRTGFRSLRRTHKFWAGLGWLLQVGPSVCGQARPSPLNSPAGRCFQGVLAPGRVGKHPECSCESCSSLHPAEGSTGACLVGG